MYLIVGINFLVFGIVLLLKPRLFYDITESWKSNVTGDPSDLYIFSTRFGGVVVAIVGVASIIVHFCCR